MCYVLLTNLLQIMYADDSLACCMFPLSCNMYEQTPIIIFWNIMNNVNMIISICILIMNTWGIYRILHRRMKNNAKPNQQKLLHGIDVGIHCTEKDFINKSSDDRFSEKNSSSLDGCKDLISSETAVVQDQSLESTRQSVHPFRMMECPKQEDCSTQGLTLSKDENDWCTVSKDENDSCTLLKDENDSCMKSTSKENMDDDSFSNNNNNNNNNSKNCNEYHSKNEYFTYSQASGKSGKEDDNVDNDNYNDADEKECCSMLLGGETGHLIKKHDLDICPKISNRVFPTIGKDDFLKLVKKKRSKNDECSKNTLK